MKSVTVSRRDPKGIVILHLNFVFMHFIMYVMFFLLSYDLNVLFLFLFFSLRILCFTCFLYEHESYKNMMRSTEMHLFTHKRYMYTVIVHIYFYEILLYNPDSTVRPTYVHTYIHT